MIPNFIHVVQAVRNAKPWPFRSADDLCRYCRACVRALHQVDPNFGELKKSGGTHCVDSQGQKVARDVALYKPTGQIVDFIQSAGFEPDASMPEPANTVVWGVGPEGEYTAADWLTPAGADTPPIDPPVDPPVDPPPVDPPASDLEARVVALEALFEELLHQQELTNKAIARLDRRRYKGTGRLPYGLGSVPVTIERLPDEE